METYTVIVRKNLGHIILTVRVIRDFPNFSDSSLVQNIAEYFGDAEGLQDGDTVVVSTTQLVMRHLVKNRKVVETLLKDAT